MLTILAALTVFGNPHLPVPPYRRLATTVVTREIDDAPFVVSGSVFFVADTSSCAAYDLRTLKRKWLLRLPVGNIVPHVRLGKPILYVHADRGAEKGSRLYAVDTSTGRLRWSRAGTGEPGDIAVQGSDIYLGLDRSSISAVDSRTHRVKWESRLPVDKDLGPQFGIESITIAGQIVLVNASGVTEALDRATGARRWLVADSFAFGTVLPTAHGIVWVPTKRGSAGVRIKNGHVIWRSTLEPAEFVGLFGDWFVGSGNGSVSAIEPTTGREAWRMPLGTALAVSLGVSGSVLRNELYVHSLDKAAIIDSRGHVRWRGPIQSAPAPPVFRRGAAIVCFGGSRLVAYRHGERAAVPAEARSRRSVARRMIRDVELLDDEDLERLNKLGEAALVPTLAAYLKASIAFDASENRPGASGAIDTFFRLEHVLDHVATRQGWRKYMTALETLPRKSRARLWLERHIGEWGPPAAVTPVFISELKKSEGLSIDDTNNSWAESYISASSDPAAVSYMIAALSDPRADPTLREDAYVNLARTGGAAGLRAVIAARHKRSTIEPLASRVLNGLSPKYSGARSKVLRQRRDEAGREWGLLQSDALGNYQDLWLAEKINGHWRHPLFSGVSLSPPYRWDSKLPLVEPKIDGKTGLQILAGDWLHLLINEAAIHRDTTGSGMTDIEKQRLGLNPATKDTDGDGESDDLDPWPNAASRPLTEAERVLSAVFEARYHFSDSDGVAVFEAPPNVKPFEMPGRTGPTIWLADHDSRKLETPLEQCFGNGVIFISFGSPNDTPSGEDEDLIQWNATKTEASVMIVTSRTGLIHNGIVVTARKFGDQWVVVSTWTKFV